MAKERVLEQIQYLRSLLNAHEAAVQAGSADRDDFRNVYDASVELSTRSVRLKKALGIR